jgi:hypothetical protein
MGEELEYLEAMYQGLTLLYATKQMNTRMNMDSGNYESQSSESRESNMEQHLIQSGLSALQQIQHGICATPRVCRLPNLYTTSVIQRKTLPIGSGRRAHLYITLGPTSTSASLTSPHSQTQGCAQSLPPATHSWPWDPKSHFRMPDLYQEAQVA